MYGLLSLYLGYVIYLAIFFHYKKHDQLSKKITIFLGIKLIILTFLYFFFFSHKMTKVERMESFKTIIFK